MKFSIEIYRPETEERFPKFFAIAQNISTGACINLAPTGGSDHFYSLNAALEAIGGAFGVEPNAEHYIKKDHFIGESKLGTFWLVELEIK